MSLQVDSVITDIQRTIEKHLEDYHTEIYITLNEKGECTITFD